jgi:hypothetical protein
LAKIFLERKQALLAAEAGSRRAKDAKPDGKLILIFVLFLILCSPYSRSVSPSVFPSACGWLIHLCNSRHVTSILPIHKTKFFKLE